MAAMMQDMPAQAMVKTDDAGIRLKNVFAAPLKDVGDFVAPVHPKSDQDALYISTALADNFVFDSLAPAEKVTLVKAFERKTAKAGTTLITQGETGDYFYILQAGQVAFIVDGVKVGAILYCTQARSTTRPRRTRRTSRTGTRRLWATKEFWMSPSSVSQSCPCA